MLLERLQLRHLCCWLLLLLHVVINSGWQVTGYDEDVKVYRFNSEYGNDSLCLKDPLNVPCQTLDLGVTILTEHTRNVVLEIQTDYSLSSVIKISSGSNSITVIGVIRHVGTFPVIECFGNAGFNIHNAQNISLKYLSLRKCHVKDDHYFPYGYAIGVRESQDVLLHNISVSNCTQTALQISNCTGMVWLFGVVLYSNGHRNQNGKTFAAGIYINQNRENTTSVQYIIEHSNFSNNTSPIHQNETETHHLLEYDGIGYGGGIYVRFGGFTSYSNFTLKFCHFSNNKGVRGGGLYAYYDEKASNNTIIVENSSFYGNYGRYSGGNVLFGYSRWTFPNNIKMAGCDLKANYALYGGGLAIFSEYGSHQSNGSIEVSNCNFVNNSGRLSAAIDIGPKDPDQDKNGFLPDIYFIDCTISNNTLGFQPGLTAPATSQNHPSIHHINSGVVVITKFKVWFGGNTIFSNNKYTALIIVSATVEFPPNSNVNFSHNLGYNGGAIGLYGFSQITLNRNLNLTFYNNHALNHGGAIVYRTIDQHDLVTGKNCFFRHNDLRNSSLVGTTHVTFENNLAEVAGDSVCSESFTDCYYQCLKSESYENQKDSYTYSDVTNCLGDFHIFPNNSQSKQLVSGGRLFNFHEHFNPSISVIPGEPIKLNFSVVDDFNQTVYPLMTVSQVNLSNDRIRVDHKYTLNTTISPKGVPGEASSFLFSIVGVRQIYFYFNISLLKCPPGFYYDYSTWTCECATKEKGYWEVIECSSFQARIQLGVWAGYIGKVDYRNLYFAPCAHPICARSSDLYNTSSIDKVSLLPKDPNHLNAYVCDENRKGILCGHCVGGHSTHYHSREFKCKANHMCHLGWLFYIISEVVPMVAFFVVIITFDISLTSGRAVGFIFFTQYLDKLTEHINDTFMYLRIPYRMFYGLFNFEFFHIEFASFCPWTGSQILGVVAMKYVTIILALGLVLILVGLLHNHCCGSVCRMKRRVNANTSVVHGLSAFLVICYAQSSRTTFYILKYTTLSGFNGSSMDTGYSYYGGLPYLRKDHLHYAIPAIVSLIFITILPPLILLFYPLSLQLLSLCKLSENWLVLKVLRLLCIHRLIPFIDCFQSCYKDKYRFFAGLYFLYRITILICFSIDPQRFQFHVYSEVSLVIFLSIHCIIQPYKRRLHNILDSLVFSNLALINGISILTEQINQSINSEEETASLKKLVLVITSVQLVLLYLPMIFLFSAFGLNLFRHLSWKRFMRKKAMEQHASNEILEYSRRTYEESRSLTNPTQDMQNYRSITFP